MTLAKLSVLMPLLVVIRPGQQQQQCSIDSLPPFGDSGNNRPDRRFQAIVPAYTFQCTGRYRVTEWMACVVRSGGSQQYYIQFQVWRPNGTTGCYSLVDYNHPLDNDGMESYLVAINDDDSLLDNCVVLEVEEDEQIEVQSGDVVGYYVDSNNVDNGIQWIEGYDDVVVYYEDDLPRESIKSHYGVGVNPTECDFVLPANVDTTSYFISLSNRAAPIISISIATIIPTSTPPPSPPPSIFTQSTDRPGLITGIAFIMIFAIAIYYISGIVIIYRIKKKRESIEPLIMASYQEISNNTHYKETKIEAYHSNATNTATISTTISTVPESISRKPSAMDKDTSTDAEYYEEISITITENLDESGGPESNALDNDSSANVSYYEGTISDIPAYAATNVSTLGNDTSSNNEGADITILNNPANTVTNVSESNAPDDTSTIAEYYEGDGTSENPAYTATSVSRSVQDDVGASINLSDNPAYTATSVSRSVQDDVGASINLSDNPAYTATSVSRSVQDDVGASINLSDNTAYTATKLYGSLDNNTLINVVSDNPAFAATTNVSESSAIDNDTSTTAEYYEGASISTSDNPAYSATNVSESIALDNVTSTIAEYYEGEGITILDNPAYSATSVSESNALDNGASTNAEYEEGDISISQNPSYTATNVSESDVVDTSPNVAYKGTDITTSDNPAYVPTQDTSENTLEYDYICP